MSKIKYGNLLSKKKNNQKAVLITAYDYSSARIIDTCNIDVVLVGDSAAMVMLGYKTTIEVSLEEMIMLAKAVNRGLGNPYLIFDMPFLSYQTSKRDAIKNCGKVLKETNCDCVKMEAGPEMVDIVKAVVDVGIPVCGHIGMMPQKYKIYHGYPIKGKNAVDAMEIIETGFALVEAGANMLIIENVPDEITHYLTTKLPVPVYSIGSGTTSDGQIIVYHDILGLYPDFKPRFIKRYAELEKQIKKAVDNYAADVVSLKFPLKKSIPHLEKTEIKKIIKKYPDFS